MGVVYYGVNHERREVVLLGKWTDLIDYEDKYSTHRLYSAKRIVNVDLALSFGSNSPEWLEFVNKVRDFKVDEVFGDCDSIDIEELFPDYKIALVRWPSDSDDIGKTVTEYYKD